MVCVFIEKKIWCVWCVALLEMCAPNFAGCNCVKFARLVFIIGCILLNRWIGHYYGAVPEKNFATFLGGRVFNE